MDSTSASGNTPPFLNKTYDMVDDPATDSIVSWGSVNNTFVVWNVPDFSRDLLPIYFKHGNFSSFLRQLNTYVPKVDPDRFEFANEGFLRGQKHLLKTISRRRPANPRSQTAPHHDITVDSSSTGACVQLENFELDEEVERLKKDKNVLMQELVRLRQQQQATDSQLAGVGRRVQVMEQRQQQMMSFLAKAMQSPSLFAQFVKQTSESNRRIDDANKKRRLPKEEENDLPVCSDLTSSDGQMVTYQPSPNEAAKAMMRQILKMDAPPTLDNSTDELEGFQIDNSCSPSMLDSRTSSSLTSGLTLTEVFSTSVQSKSSADSSFSIGHPADISDSQSSSRAVKNEKPVKQMAVDGPAPQVNVEISDSSFVICDATNVAYINSLSANINGPIDIESDIILPEDCVENFLDDVPRLPAINDAFWEQFLAASPPTSDADEISSISPTTGATNETDSGQERGSRKTHFVDGLAEQMGLLSSRGRVG